MRTSGWLQSVSYRTQKPGVSIYGRRQSVPTLVWYPLLYAHDNGTLGLTWIFFLPGKIVLSLSSTRMNCKQMHPMRKCINGVEAHVHTWGVRNQKNNSARMQAENGELGYLLVSWVLQVVRLDMLPDHLDHLETNAKQQLLRITCCNQGFYICQKHA
jgi:hypothetical protein